MNWFVDINEEEYKGRIVILDIDGTLVVDGRETLERNVEKKLLDIIKVSEVYFCSNGSYGRTKKLSEQYGIPCIDRRKYRKPNPFLLRDIERKGKQVVVIGDQIITDGFLALFTSSFFVHVKRIRREGKSKRAVLAHRIDYAIGPLFVLGFRIAPYIELLRIHQWTKNLLIFTPAFFGGLIGSWSALYVSGIAFVLFSFLASAVYIINDYVDTETDSLHSTKYRRPFPSGRARKDIGVILAGALTIFTIAGLFFFPALIPFFAVYGVLSLLYSFVLKHVVFVDIALVAFFYVLRVLVGGVVTGVELSPWIIIGTFSIALFLVVGKRRGELQQGSRRKVLKGYSKSMLYSLFIGSAILSLISYSLWSIVAHSSSWAPYSIPLVAFVIGRVLYYLHIHPNDGERPETIIFKDPTALFVAFLWLWFMGILFYT